MFVRSSTEQSGEDLRRPKALITGMFARLFDSLKSNGVITYQYPQSVSSNSRGSYQRRAPKTWQVTISKPMNLDKVI